MRGEAERLDLASSVVYIYPILPSVSPKRHALAVPFPCRVPAHFAFLPCAFSAFFRLLLIMTTLKKLPTTAPPSSSRMTGMRMAQTRGGKSDCTGWESSTKGYDGRDD